MGMVVLRRLLSTIPVLLGVSLIVFSMLHLTPGDPVEIIGDEMLMDRAARDELRRQLGLDRPLVEQYVRYLTNALQGDLGRSIRTNRSVRDDIATQMPRTVELALSAGIVGLLLGLPLGVLGAVYFRRWPDTIARVFSLLGVAVPNFWLGIQLVLLFSVALRMLPIGGQGTLWHLVMPSITLGTGMAAIIARTLRASLLDVLGTDYIRTARAKGLREQMVILRHGLRNALIPTVTIFGLQVGFLLSGALVVETVFSRQGLGRLTVQAVLNRDFPLIQGTVLVSAVAYVFVNLLVDLSYSYLDPRSSRA